MDQNKLALNRQVIALQSSVKKGDSKVSNREGGKEDHGEKKGLHPETDARGRGGDLTLFFGRVRVDRTAGWTCDVSLILIRVVATK